MLLSALFICDHRGIDLKNPGHFPEKHCLSNKRNYSGSSSSNRIPNFVNSWTSVAVVSEFAYYVVKLPPGKNGSSAG